jgi:hypothetical protein
MQLLARPHFIIARAAASPTEPNGRFGGESPGSCEESSLTEKIGWFPKKRKTPGPGVGI